MEEVKKKPNWKKTAIISLAVILLLTVGAVIWTETLWYSVSKQISYNEELHDATKIVVTLKEEYAEKYFAKGFEVKDFKWNNVEKIEFDDEYKNTFTTDMYITVYLKETGETQAKMARIRFSKLQFVCCTRFAYKNADRFN